MLFQKLWLRAQLWHVEREIEAEKEELEALLFDRWTALEAQDASDYHALGSQSLRLKSVLRDLNHRRDDLVAQLKRLDP